MKSNWLNENKKQIDYYLSSTDFILMDRKKSLSLLLDIYEAYFNNLENNSFLDFGSGGGALTKIFFDKYPKNNFTLLDGSKNMIEKSKSIFGSERFSYINISFEDFMDKNKDEEKFDLIYSSMAIHHLPHEEKRRLFSKFYTLLKFNGLFINIDVVLPTSKKTEEIQFEMWKRSIINELVKDNRQAEIDNHINLPEEYKGKSENKPSTLISQLEMLSNIGFRDVECYLKNGIFAFYGGQKT